jgi:ABC-type lipoprotein release transport system permease subunit
MKAPEAVPHDTGPGRLRLAGWPHLFAALRALPFAWRSLVRQPARATLGVLGVAAVGALLFDMLLLSQGLVVSMRDLLDRTGWDVRVTAGDELPGRTGRVENAMAAMHTIGTLPSVHAVLAVRFVDARIDRVGRAVNVTFQGISGSASQWTILEGRDLRGRDEVVVNQSLKAELGTRPGAELTLRAFCLSGDEALPPTRLRVVGVAEFPFDSQREHVVAASLDTLAAACGGNTDDEVNLLLAKSDGDPAGTADAIQAALPGLRAVTNEEMLGRLERTSFSYFRQISTVLTTVTLAFAVLLITVLLTVSVNQRLGEIAALRALGFSRRRVVADVLSESALIVGSGGLLSLPLGWLLARWLDRILTGMPGIPTDLHFFVFEPSALAVHGTLLGLTAIVAALYPMRIVSRLPIAATLRDEVIG